MAHIDLPLVTAPVPAYLEIEKQTVMLRGEAVSMKGSGGGETGHAPADH